MKKCTVIIFMFLLALSPFLSIADEIMLDIPTAAGQYKQKSLSDFIDSHRYKKASKLTTRANYYHNTDIDVQKRCRLSSAYELAAILAGDTALLAWANGAFGVNEMQRFINDEINLQKKIFNALVLSCAEF